MRALIVNPSPIRGGAEQMLLSFARGASRVDLEFVCLADGPFVAELRETGAVVHFVDAGRMRQVGRWAATVRELAALARSCDLVCSWQVKGHYYGTPAARIARRPALWWDHGIRPVRGEPSAFAGGTIPRTLRADLVLTSSHAAAARHRRARAIHPGIDVAAFEQATPSPLPFGTPGDGPVVGIVGRLQPWKGQHVFLRAAARVAEARPDARFAIIGDAIGGFSAGYPAQLRALAAELRIEDRVCFAGEATDVAGALASLDVFVHASHEEPFGIVVVEALASGVPVVATRGGGVPEIVTDGVDGFLVTSGDDEQMASRILTLLDDEPLRRSVADAGRIRARASFGVERMVAEFESALLSFAGAQAVTA